MSETTPAGGPPAPAQLPDKRQATTLTAAPPAEPDKVSQLALEEAMARLRGEQSLSLAVVGGAAAALVGAILWGLITAVIHAQYGIMAIGIGLLVGFAVKKLGKGVDTTFRIVAAAFALLGSLFGDYLATCLLAKDPFWEVLSRPGDVLEFMKNNFGFMDALFYGIAVYCGWQFALRQITEDDVKRLAGEAPKGL